MIVEVMSFKYDKSHTRSTLLFILGPPCTQKLIREPPQPFGKLDIQAQF